MSWLDFLDKAEDSDKLFSYQTKQQVNIQDRYLGITEKFLQLSFILYIVFGIFVFNDGYLVFESSRGAIATHVRGDALSVSSGKPGTRYFSAEELTFPGLENGNVFVATREKVIRQKRGICEDPSMFCASDDDCSPALRGKCTDKGFCEEPSWCNADDQGELYEIDVGNLMIWVKSSILFVRLAPEKVYTSETGHAYPERGYNVFSVRDLLMLCEPVPVRYEEISELGAVIEVQLVWSCNVERDDCHPTVAARRIDVQFDPHNIGYAFGYAEYINDDERFLKKVNGVRFLFRSVGLGRKFSINETIMRVSTASTLISLSQLIADLLMLSFFARKAKYRARKYEVSPDFSDYMDKLKKHKDEELAAPNFDDDEKEAQSKEEEWQQRLNEED